MSSRRRASRTRPWRCLPIQRATPVRVRRFAVSASSLAHRGRAAARRTRYWKWPPAQSLHSQSPMNTPQSSQSRATKTRKHEGLLEIFLRVSVTPWLVGAIVVLTSPLLRATTVVPSDFTEMVNGSQVIVHGAVVD